MAPFDRFTPLEIFGIFKEQHRLCSPLDLDADPAAILTPEMSIRDWRAANWLAGWKKLGQYIYLDQYFSPMIEEITLTCTRPIEKIEEKRRKKGFWNAINIFDPDRYENLTGEVKTFRDLIEKIAMEKGLL